jgi:hypothetical protein
VLPLEVSITVTTTCVGDGVTVVDTREEVLLLVEEELLSEEVLVGDDLSGVDFGSCPWLVGVDDVCFGVDDGDAGDADSEV